jgi:SAM-dependent methyltransferase
MMSLKNKLKNSSTALSVFYALSMLKDFLLFDFWGLFSNLKWYLSDLSDYKNQLKLKKKNTIIILQPSLKDKTSTTPLEPVYFYQDTWAAHKIFELKPQHHYDIGSSAKTIGLISQFVPTTMVDIRPIDLKLNNLYFQKGTILSLPFENASIKSISSLCVVEHIGLGRYGDPVDVLGSEKAIKEIQRVTAPEGIILISVPVDDENKIYFNSHRAFTREYILELFNNCELMEEKYIYGNELVDNYSKDKKLGAGLFMFKMNHNTN